MDRRFAGDGVKDVCRFDLLLFFMAYSLVSTCACAIKVSLKACDNISCAWTKHKHDEKVKSSTFLI